jgi:cell wall-associated NlpC family hydrolase
MSYVVCIVAVAPLRKEASHRSEIVSELLLGEFATVLEETKDFIKLKCLYDDYEGWCQRPQLTRTNQVIDTTEFSLQAINEIEFNHQPCRISIATPVYNSLQLEKYIVNYKSINTWNAATAIFSEENIQKITFNFLNTPYLWGGKSVFGIDCSGFVQQVFKMFNIQLPRDAYQQAEIGESIGFLLETKCGDIAFFDSAEGRIIHVGILLNSETIIHSSSKVRIDKIDNAGIINSDTGERTHQLRLIKRYIKNPAVKAGFNDV